ncbi:MAG: response regulator, partial [Cyanobacteria bacterium J06642_11]
FRQILINLLGNAVKFTHAGEIIIRITATINSQTADPDQQNYTIQCAVCDTGIGIPADRLDSLFNAFQQVDSSTTRKYGGTGLGLAISQRLCEAMGGTIWVESEPDQGSTFFFTLNAMAITNSSPALTTADLHGKRLLIVDDNTTNRDILTYQAENWQMQVWSARSGYEALGFIEQLDTPFDIAILDMQMPGMDGLTLAHTLQKQCPKLPLIMLTSIRAPGLKEKATQAGMLAFLNKPCRQTDLHNALTYGITGQNRDSKPANQGKKPNNIMATWLPLKILVAEDNLVNQQLAKQWLAKLGYRPDMVSNGLEVLEALERQHYDVILMDIQMPEMDGLTTTETIRKSFQANVQPHIIAMTANAMTGDRDRCLTAGMNGYISKPMHIEELITAFEQYAHRQGISAPSTLIETNSQTEPSTLAPSTIPASKGPSPSKQAIASFDSPHTGCQSEASIADRNTTALVLDSDRLSKGLEPLGGIGNTIAYQGFQIMLEQVLEQSLAQLGNCDRTTMQPILTELKTFGQSWGLLEIIHLCDFKEDLNSPTHINHLITDLHQARQRLRIALTHLGNSLNQYSPL